MPARSMRAENYCVHFSLVLEELEGNQIYYSILELYLSSLIPHWLPACLLPAFLPSFSFLSHLSLD